MALATAADFASYGQKVLNRVADDAHPMPPVPYARLTDAERASLTAWINAGAPAQICTNPTPVMPGPTTPGDETDPENEPGVTCYKLTARASKSGGAYMVPTTPDLYQCFQYALPWGSKKVQIVSARPIVDNDKVLHHWILYNNVGSVTDGASSSCVGAHPDAANVAGWAPGGADIVPPKDVGIRVEPGGFTLEIHYNNSTGAVAPDTSGVNLCVTENLREHEAAVHWLGTQSLNKTTATGTCTPVNKVDVTIIGATPHMHLQGRHMKTVINRKGGGTETLLDEPFDFNTQISYDVNAVVHPGDTLTTTCTFARPTPFGQGTNQEMCYNFLLAYPAGELSQALSILRKYDCTGL